MKFVCRPRHNGYNASATNLLLDSGWHYLACPRCSKKDFSEDCDLWFNKCETKVDMPVARFMVRFEVEDNTRTAVFIALDSEV
ncbi:hypothetical protein MKW94_012464 [Papaver nudicaule]|uniref:Replication factor A C-terminal domain-containing protein n=1 Tax=Papaver nudicaule TaxID=74823 RepID=A0AA41V468_PAPNU|nr:hypothetical protein [Papaver nudicaule]